MPMFSSGPKNTDKYYWTEHAKFKMKFYGLSAQRVLSVIKNPERREVGIVKNTIAVMRPAGTDKNRYEIWVMIQRGARNVKHETNDKIISDTKYKIPNTRYKIISAWKYPGVSPKNKPIPEEILRDIEEYLK